jgi:acyl carrier protein
MYAAGNTFLDALMQRRRAEGRPGLSIAWGPWTRVGMAARMDAAGQAMRRSRGVGALSPESALAALELALAGAPAHLVVASIDWPRFARTQGRARLPDALRALVTEADTAPLASPETELGIGAEPGALRARLRETPASERLGLLLRFIQLLLARTLRFGWSEALDPRQGFFDMGVDSLSAVELRTRLERALGATLSSTTLLDFATPEALARHVHDLVLTGPDAATTPAPARELGHG